MDKLLKDILKEIDDQEVLLRDSPNDTKIIKGQPHKLAYITEDEGEVLEALGGSGEEVDGIPAYFDWSEGAGYSWGDYPSDDDDDDGGGIEGGAVTSTVGEKSEGTGSTTGSLLDKLMGKKTEPSKKKTGRPSGGTFTDTGGGVDLPGIDSKLGLVTDTKDLGPMHAAFQPGGILSVEDPFEKEDMGSFTESALETLAYLASLGILDIELSGKDKWGKDWSLGKDQPKGVEVNPGAAVAALLGGPIASLVGGQLTAPGQTALGAISPSYVMDFTKGTGEWANPSISQLPGAVEKGVTELAEFISDPGRGVQNVVAGITTGAENLVDSMTTPLGWSPPAQDQQVASTSPFSPTGPTTAPTTPTTAPSDDDPYFDDYIGGDTTQPLSIPTTTTTDVATAIAIAEDEPTRGWDASRWAWTSQGGPVEAYQAGGLTGMMQRANMVDQRRGFMPTFQPQQGTQGYPQRPQWPGQRPQWPTRPQWPPRPQFPRPRQDTLKPETYFHTHEGGKIDYPNFPKQFVNPPGTKNPFKPDRRPRPYPIVNPFSPQQEEIIPPISIAETEATAMAPEDIEQTTITSAVEETPTMPREINIRMPEDITANVDFPEEIIGTTQGYNRGGEIEKYGWGGMLRGLAPMAAGFALGPMGHIPAMIGGGLTSYALGGKKRSMLDAIKGGLMAYGGSGMYRAGMGASGLSAEEMAGPELGKRMTAQTKDVIPLDSSSPWALQTPTAPVERSILGQVQAGMQGGPQGWADKMTQSFGGLGNILSTGDLGAYQNILSKSALPIGAAMAGMSMTPPSEMPDVPEQTPLQVSRMTPEQRRAYIMAQRKKFAGGAGRTMTFAPPNVDVGGWRPNIASGYAPTSAARGGTVRPNQMVSSNEKGWSGLSGLPALLQEVISMRQAQGLPIPFMKKQPTNVEDIEETEMVFAEAAKGGVMEIDEEMQSGSFVLPADVVSNVGDGSSSSGHRRLADIFEMEEVEGYARGGTGILKGPVKGVGSGLDDLIQTGIDGVRVARLSDGEFVVPKKIVNEIGDGSQRAGAEKLYDFMKDVRLKKHGTSKQPKEMHMSGLRKMV